MKGDIGVPVPVLVRPQLGVVEPAKFFVGETEGAPLQVADLQHKQFPTLISLLPAISLRTATLVYRRLAPGDARQMIERPSSVIELSDVIVLASNQLFGEDGPLSLHAPCDPNVFVVRIKGQRYILHLYRVPLPQVGVPQYWSLFHWPWGIKRGPIRHTVYRVFTPT